MRYRVQFRYREGTGEVEVFRVETVDTGARSSDHDAAHDRVAAEVAGILETGAVIEELLPDAPEVAAEPQGRRQAPEDPRSLPPETHSG